MVRCHFVTLNWQCILCYAVADDVVGHCGSASACLALTVCIVVPGGEILGVARKTGTIKDLPLVPRLTALRSW